MIYDEADDMCPNCITPWKCNGPHVTDDTLTAAVYSEGPLTPEEARVIIDAGHDPERILAFLFGESDGEGVITAWRGEADG